MFNKTQILQTMLQLLFGILGALIVQFIFLNSSQKIATVDIAGMVKSFEEEVLKQKLSKEELTQKVTRFGEALNSTVIEYANQKHLILVPKEVVTAGDIDKTNEIKAIIKKRMNT